MDNKASGKKNSMDLEDEHDLTLSLKCGSPKRATQSSSSSSPSPSPSPSPPQTNMSLIKLQVPYPNFLLGSCSNYNTNLFLGSSSNSNLNTNHSLVSSSNSNRNTNHSLVSSSIHAAKVEANGPASALTHRSRRASSQRRNQRKSETVVAPFPWATDRRATVHNRKYLLENNILSITGRVHCKKCEQEFDMRFDLEEKLDELCKFIKKERGSMHDRAPVAWVNPMLQKCMHCGRENSVRPILGDIKKRAINWLFLFLGQMLGCCTLDQLKYFCKHTNNHRTGAKDRLLYLTYMSLFKQLVPESFDSI